MNTRSQKKNHDFKIWVKPLRYKDMLILEKIIKKHLKPVTYNVRIGRDKYESGIPFPTGENLYDSVKRAPKKRSYLYACLRTSSPNIDVRARWLRCSIYGDRRTNKGDELSRVDSAVEEMTIYLNSRSGLNKS